MIQIIGLAVCVAVFTVIFVIDVRIDRRWRQKIRTLDSYIDRHPTARKLASLPPTQLRIVTDRQRRAR